MLEGRVESETMSPGIILWPLPCWRRSNCRPHPCGRVTPHVVAGDHLADGVWRHGPFLLHHPPPAAAAPLPLLPHHGKMSLGCCPTPPSDGRDMLTALRRMWYRPRHLGYCCSPDIWSPRLWNARRAVGSPRRRGRRCLPSLHPGCDGRRGRPWTSQ